MVGFDRDQPRPYKGRKIVLVTSIQLSISVPALFGLSPKTSN